MVAPTFGAVGDIKGDRTLADITVTGYEAPVYDDEEEEWSGGAAGGQFIVRFLTSSGTQESAYYWIDDGETGPGWFANAVGKPIAGGAASIAIPAGQALWTRGAGYTIVAAGEVSTSDIQFKTTTSGHVAVGNGTPADLTLGKLTVTGYSAPVYDDEEEEYSGGAAGGEVILRLLDSTGTQTAAYYWIDDGETGPGWFANAVGKPITGGATSVSIPAGLGLWVRGSGYNLYVPAPEL